MGTVTATTSRTIEQPPERVLAQLRDLEDRRRILTENYSDVRVERDSTPPVLAYHFAAGGRERDYRLRVEDSPEGLRERDELSSFVNEWTVRPAGAGSNVTLTCSWQGASGFGGVMEGLFAPLGLRRIQAQVLERLAGAL